jgi:hypothetical protein
MFTALEPLMVVVELLGAQQELLEADLVGEPGGGMPGGP